MEGLTDMDYLANVEEIKKRVAAACKRSGRNPEDVKILPVSKNHPQEVIEDLYQAGWRDFGENYVQELRNKHDHLPDDIRWHMIGHMQRNKVKYIASYIEAIHSVDTIKLLHTIEKEGRKADRVIPVLLEVNVGREESKFGVMPELEDCMALANETLKLPHVKLRGLMTSAPYYDDPEQDRPIFRKLKELMEAMNQANDQLQLDQLSMGMTHDFEVAVEEGSTCVRIGTAIFGKRDYSNKGY